MTALKRVWQRSEVIKPMAAIAFSGWLATWFFYYDTGLSSLTVYNLVVMAAITALFGSGVKNEMNKYA